MSGKLKSIGVTSDKTLNKFTGLEKRTVRVDKKFRSAGRSAMALSGKLKALGADAIRSMPGASFLLNPIVATTAAIGVMTGSALKFDEGMAKINITAQLTDDKLASLRTKILGVGKAMGSDPAQLTQTFEKILSQVGDVDVSMKIFESTLKGSKAGFTDASVVADALAQSVSAIGANKVAAADVLDVLFAAKRVGAGEFGDYARYVPGLIADARNLGFAFQDTAGLFAYMTAKGNTAEKSAMYMQNAFTALSKTQIQKGLKDAGINIFDKEGNTRNIADIMDALGTKLKALGSDAARSNFLEKIGLRDAQAKTAFSILTADVDKLRTTLKATTNASGETDAALALSSTPLQKLTELWNKLKIAALEGGGGFVAILNPIIEIGTYMIDFLSPVLKQVASGFKWIAEVIKENKSVVLGIGAAIGAWALASKLAVLWQGLAAIATGGWTAAIGLLNIAFAASPLGWLAVGIGVIVGAVIYAYNEFDVFRDTVWGLWEVFKQVFTNIGTFFSKIFSPIIDTFNALKEGRWADAALSAGEAFLNLNPIGMAVQTVKFAAEGGFTKDIGKAYNLGVGASQFKTDQSKVPGADSALLGNAPGPANPNPNGNFNPAGGTLPITTTKTTTPIAEAIATGGRKSNNFNITIGSVVEKFTIENSDSTLGVDEMKDKVLDALMRVLNMSQSLANG